MRCFFYQADTGNHRPGLFYRGQIRSDCVAGRLFHRYGAGQLYFVLVKFGSVGVLGTAIALTLIRELGPVLAAIMITARAGSAMTAEIGIQRIAE